jgi:hypothetical protein
MKGHMKMHGEHHAHGGDVHHAVKKHSMHAMKHRSHHAKGGKIESPMHGQVDEDPTPSDVYAGGNSPTVHEASEKHASRKRGGRAKKHVGVHGHHAHHRLDRPARKSGGKVGGSEMNPLSAAHNVKTPHGRMVEPGES